jgi:hypothetical protein
MISAMYIQLALQSHANRLGQTPSHSRPGRLVQGTNHGSGRPTPNQATTVGDARRRTVTPVVLLKFLGFFPSSPQPATAGSKKFTRKTRAHVKEADRNRHFDDARHEFAIYLLLWLGFLLPYILFTCQSRILRLSSTSRCTTALRSYAGSRRRATAARRTTSAPREAARQGRRAEDLLPAPWPDDQCSMLGLPIKCGCLGCTKEDMQLQVTGCDARY